jgi:hypothetical protein
MITGAHSIIYSTAAEADRKFFQEVLGFPSVDAGRGSLIFALPPSEVALHPGETNGKHEFYLMCDDVQQEIAELLKKGVTCSDVHEERWGSLTMITLPSGGTIGLHQPKHPVAHQAEATKVSSTGAQ